MVRHKLVLNEPNEPAKGPYFATLKLHHGGGLSSGLTDHYIGGVVTTFQNVDVKNLSIAALDEYATRLGYVGMKRFYRFDSLGKLRIVLYETDLWQFIEDNGAELKVYLCGEKYTTALADENPENGLDIELDANSYSVIDDIVTSHQPSSVDKGKGVAESVEQHEDGEDGDDEDTSGSEFKDSDYNISSDEDDGQFDRNIDINEEWAGLDRGKKIAENQESSESEDSSDIESSDGFESLNGSDDEGVHPTRNIYNPADVYNPKFEVGLEFSNKTHFREAIDSLAIITGRTLRCHKNDLRRICAKCMEEGCDWHINATKINGESTFKVREVQLEHKCGREFYCKNMKTNWLCKKYENKFRADPQRRAEGFRQEAVLDLNVHISKWQAYRAKKNVLKKIEGSSEEQYSKLWDYAEALRAANPGSTIKIALQDKVDSSGRKKFDKLYICFKALQEGFVAGCRPVIGVDGCHLKGPNGGVLLTAVAQDPNNNLYPLAYAVVGSETKEAWVWFLRILKEDLNIVREDCYTFISDKQKGLLPAFEIVLPGVDNRFCVRHLHGNMKKAGHKGLDHKIALWAAAKASTVPEFYLRMNEIEELDPLMFQWLQDKHPSEWSKSHFSTFPKSDMLLNNGCESFNSIILEAREKAILTMLEWIRLWLLKHLTDMREMCEKKWKGKNGLLRLCVKVNLRTLLI